MNVSTLTQLKINGRVSTLPERIYSRIVNQPPPRRGLPARDSGLEKF